MSSFVLRYAITVKNFVIWAKILQPWLRLLLTLRRKERATPEAGRDKADSRGTLVPKLYLGTAYSISENIPLNPPDLF